MTLQHKFSQILHFLETKGIPKQPEPQVKGNEDKKAARKRAAAAEAKRMATVQMNASLLHVQMGVLSLQMNIQNVLMQAMQNKELLGQDQKNQLIMNIILMVNMLTDLIQSGQDIPGSAKIGEMGGGDDADESED